MIKILTEQYGYEEKDLRTEQGNPLTNAVLLKMIEDEEEASKALKEAPKVEAKPIEEVVTKEPTRITHDDVGGRNQTISGGTEILVMAGDASVIYHAPNTGRTYQFSDFGQIDYITYEDLRAMANRHPKFLKDGAIIILDEEVNKRLGYNHIKVPTNRKVIETALLQTDGDTEGLIKYIESVPEATKRVIASTARQLFEERELYDNRVIDALEDYFGFSLEDGTPKADINGAGKMVNGKIIAG